MRVYNPSKKDITQLPFQLVYEAGKDNCKDRQKEIAFHSIWALPQILAYFGRMKPVAVEDQEGIKKYSGIATAKKHLESLSEEDKDWFRGLIIFISTGPRGNIFPKTGKALSADLLPFAANVPLFLAAFKKYQNIPYSDWDVESIKPFIDEGLYISMTQDYPEYSPDILLAYRQVGSTPKSGESEGITKNPLSAVSITSVGDPVFDKLPRLTKLMLCQTWVYHPSVWHDYMILDSKNWDNKPEKLIETDIQPTNSKKSASWEDM